MDDIQMALEQASIGTTSLPIIETPQKLKSKTIKKDQWRFCSTAREEIIRTAKLHREKLKDHTHLAAVDDARIYENPDRQPVLVTEHLPTIESESTEIGDAVKRHDTYKSDCSKSKGMHLVVFVNGFFGQPF